jgi:hypothetical protein
MLLLLCRFFRRWLFEEAPCGAAPAYILFNGLVRHALCPHCVHPPRDRAP